MKNYKRVAPFGLGRVAQIALVAVGLVFGAQADVAHAQQDVDPLIPNDPRIMSDGMGGYIITAGNGEIINYNEFGIGEGRMIQFIQGNPTFRVLNRVVTMTESQIYGSLTADGRVYLVNPAGITIGPNGSVTTPGAFYAIAGDLSDGDFIARNDHFTNMQGSVIVDELGPNAGSISAKDVYLIGKTIQNHGTIMGTGAGVIVMVTGAGDPMQGGISISQLGTRITVVVDGATLIDGSDQNDANRPPFFGASTPSDAGVAAITNTGTITNPGGHVFLGSGDIASFALHNTGQIDALGGEVNVRVVDGLALNDGTIDATGSTFGGTVTFKAPSVVNTGTIRADGVGGQVNFFGDDHAYMSSTSLISARGGQVRAGSYANNGLTIMEGPSGLGPGATIDVSGGGGLASIFGQSFVLNGNIFAHGGLAIVALTGNGQVLGVTDTPGDDTLDLTRTGDLAGRMLSTSLSTMTGSLSLVAVQDILIASDVNLTDNNRVFLDSRDGSILINAAMNGLDDLAVIADNGFIFVRVPLTLTDDVIFKAMAIGLSGGTLTTGGTQRYVGPVFLGDDMMLTGTEITFFNEVSSRVLGGPGFASLSINANNTYFNGIVGGDGTPGQETRFLSSLLVNGNTFLNAESVRTKGSQQYLGGMTTDRSALLLSDSLGNIQFGGALNGVGDLDLQTGGTTIFEGLVGGTSIFDSITTDAPGSSVIAANMTAGTLTFGDGVALGADATVNGLTAVNFNSTIQGQGHDLNVVSPLTNFNGDVAGVGFLQTDAAGVTIVNTANVQAQSIRFNDAVVATADTFVQGNDFVDFASTLNGGVNVRVMSDSLVRFGGNVGENTALASLRIDSGGTGQISQNPIVVDANLIRTVGDILINPDGRSVPAAVATLAATGSLTLESMNGNILAGVNEKITSLGSLSIVAANGVATLNDLNAVNNISVVAGAIIFRGREAGTLLNYLGQTITDRGMEVIAGDSIFLSTTPGIIGQGEQPIFATRSGTNITGLPDGFALRAFANITGDQFTFNPILDLTVLSDQDLATAYDSPLKFKDKIELDPIAIRSLAALGINLEPLAGNELVATVGGNQILIDTRRGGLNPTPAKTSANRLRRESVIRVLDEYGQIFAPSTGVTTDDQDDDYERRLAERYEEVRTVLAKAWQDYTANGVRSANPAGFRTYCQETGNHEEALTCVNGLERLFRELWTMGATPYEMQICEDKVFDQICPPGMQPAMLREAVGTDLISKRKHDAEKDVPVRQFAIR